MRRSLRLFLVGAAMAFVAVAALGVDAASAQGSARQGGAGQYEARLPVPAPPSPPRLVNDLAGIFSAAERDALERKLVAVDDSTGAQIAVVTVRTLDGYEVVEYATEILRAWGVGRAGVDNGVVLLVAVDDREVGIATGYGAEGALTDATSGTIIRQTIVPRFREGQYFAGVDAATDDIIAALAGEFSRPDTPTGGDAGIGNLLCCLFMLFVVMLVFVSRQKGGPTGGSTRKRRGRRSPGVIFIPGGFSGGFGGGGSFGGGGFGGGGFGGFGGGFGGGGGAGGSW